MNKSPVTAIIVGAGHRAMVYSKLALTKPCKKKALYGKIRLFRRYVL